MITKFDIFESLNESIHTWDFDPKDGILDQKNKRRPKMGDYVIVEQTYHKSYPQALYDTINGKIGFIMDIVKEKYSPEECFVLYENVPVELRNPKDREESFPTQIYFDSYGVRKFPVYDIQYWSKNKEDLTPDKIENYLRVKKLSHQFDM